MQYNWWEITPETRIDTPFLAIYTDRIKYNIEQLIRAVDGDPLRLRPHIKTHKIGEILQLYKDFKIEKVKCATIAEAELSAMHHISDILLAYQPAGLKLNRWIRLIQRYRNSIFSIIVDNIETATLLAETAKENNLVLNVYIDMNTGMNRTGIDVNDSWDDLALQISQLPNLNFLGLHIYDGHIKGTVEQREQQACNSFSKIISRLSTLQERLNYKLKIVAGGSNTFPFYAGIKEVECSPGTFVFWDVNYQTNLPEQEFKNAAVIVGTVISKPSASTLCVDIGYKSVSSENPLDKRLAILNDENLIPISHSEEHLVLENKGVHHYSLGETIYALPYHVCPTCALYDSVQVVNNNHEIYDTWLVEARNKK